MVKSPTFCNGLHCQECDVYDAYISSSLPHRSGVTPVVITDSCSSAAVSHCLLVCFSQCDTQDSVNNSSRTAGTCAARSPPPHHHPFTDFFSFIQSGTRSSIKHHHHPPPLSPALVSVDLSDTHSYLMCL